VSLSVYINKGYVCGGSLDLQTGDRERSLGFDVAAIGITGAEGLSDARLSGLTGLGAVRGMTSLRGAI